MSSLRQLASAAALGVALAASSVAHAISYDAKTNGLSEPDNVDFIGSGSLGLKEQAGFKFLGVKGGSAGNEIDIGQSLTIKFTGQQQIFDYLTIGLLFDGPEYGDPLETALVHVLPMGSVFSLTTQSWNGAGWVINLGLAEFGKGGVWKIMNPFGNVAVSEITLYPDASVAGSDFGLVGFKTHGVPDTASTVSLFGLSLLGLAFLRRRARA